MFLLMLGVFCATSSLMDVIVEVKFTNTVEPRYNKVPGTAKITLLYQVSHYIRVKKTKK